MPHVSQLSINNLHLSHSSLQHFVRFCLNATKTTKTTGSEETNSEVTCDVVKAKMFRPRPHTSRPRLRPGVVMSLSDIY